ncbi:hypothetical protein Aperf_G00000095697 [Anoplocephala perfoliata]
MACIRPFPNFNANLDAQALHEAMKGMGTDEDAIIGVLAHRTSLQRQEVAQAYKAQYGTDLIEHLSKELHGDFLKAVTWSFYNQAQLNAAALQEAMKGIGTDEATLIDVICTSNNNEIQHVKEAFLEMTGNALEDKIESECRGDFKRVLAAILQASRETGYDKAQAKRDAEDLFNAGENKIGTDESAFIRILCTRSHAQIHYINEFYLDLCGHDLITAIEKETSGDFEKALTRIVMVAKSKIKTLAEILYQSMKGLGTRDRSLIRIILGYAETNLGEIKACFEETYNKTLAEMIASETSGDYGKFLLAIVG